MTRPFPWHEVPSLTRQELDAERAVQEVLRHPDTDKLRHGAQDLLQCKASLRLGGLVARGDMTSADATNVGVILCDADAANMAQAFLVETEGALASAMVCSALGQKRPRVIVAERPTAALCGATAAVLVSLARRAGWPLRVLAAGPLQDLARDLARVQGPLWRQTARVDLGAETFAAAIWRGRPDKAPTHPSGDVRRSHVPVRFTLVVAHCEATVSEVRALGIGDVFVPQPSRHTLSERGLCGPCALVQGTSERAFGATLTDEGLQVTFEPVALGLEPRDHGPNMSLPEQDVPSAPPTMQDVLEDAPVMLRVEVGHAEMPAREWAALRPGDVSPLGVKPSQPVVLRVSGTELARGTLVLIDGEVGVRITEKVTE
jgi:flagellar motor switch protein FliN/FliY